jgi:hypothetical protein
MVVIAVLMMAGAAWGQTPTQDQIPSTGLMFKGTCVGNHTEPDGTVYPEAHAIDCDSLIVMTVKGHTLISMSNGDPSKPVFMFAGVLAAVNTIQHFDPYFGPVGSLFPIDLVSWGEGAQPTPVHIDNPAYANDSTDRGCYFHFDGQGWNNLTEVGCDLIMGTKIGTKRVTVTFKTERKFTVDGQQVSVEFGTHGFNSFRTEWDQTKINGTCGAGVYQTPDGVLRQVKPGSSMDHLFQVICYKQ